MNQRANLAIIEKLCNENKGMNKIWCSQAGSVWFLFSFPILIFFSCFQDFIKEKNENNRILFLIFISCFHYFFCRILKTENTRNEKQKPNKPLVIGDLISIPIPIFTGTKTVHVFTPIVGNPYRYSSKHVFSIIPSITI